MNFSSEMLPTEQYVRDSFISNCDIPQHSASVLHSDVNNDRCQFSDSLAKDGLQLLAINPVYVTLISADPTTVNQSFGRGQPDAHCNNLLDGVCNRSCRRRRCGLSKERRCHLPYEVSPHHLYHRQVNGVRNNFPLASTLAPDVSKTTELVSPNGASKMSDLFFPIATKHCTGLLLQPESASPLVLNTVRFGQLSVTKSQSTDSLSTDVDGVSTNLHNLRVSE